MEAENILQLFLLNLISLLGIEFTFKDSQHFPFAYSLSLETSPQNRPGDLQSRAKSLSNLLDHICIAITYRGKSHIIPS